MAWIESHDDIGDHVKTQKLCDALAIDVPAAVGYLHLLWHHALKVAWENGDLSGHRPAHIARACWWQGNPEAFIKALQDSGYLDGMTVHDWTLYAKELIYQRAYSKRRSKTADNQLTNTCLTPDNHTSHKGSPNPTQPYPTKNQKLDHNYLNKKNIDSLLKLYGDVNTVMRHLTSLGFTENQACQAVGKNF